MNELSPRRAELVAELFTHLVGDDSVLTPTTEQLTLMSKNPTLLLENIAEAATKNKKEPVTLEVFQKYYLGLSKLIMSDDYFELMFRNAWHMLGGYGQAANTVNLRVSVLYATGLKGMLKTANLALAFDKVAHTVPAIKEQLEKEGQIKHDWDVIDITW